MWAVMAPAGIYRFSPFVIASAVQPVKRNRITDNHLMCNATALQYISV